MTDFSAMWQKWLDTESSFMCLKASFKSEKVILSEKYIYADHNWGWIFC